MTNFRALEIASAWKDSVTSSTAYQLLKAIKSAEFQTSIVVSTAILSVTLPLKHQLQEKKIEMKKAIRLCDLVHEELKDMRRSAGEKFKNMYQTVEAVCSSNKIPIILARKSAETNAEDHYRIQIFIPFLDSAIQNLELRFLNHKELLMSFDALLSNDVNDVQGKNLISRYAKVLHCRGNENIAMSEIKLWQRLLKSLYAQKSEKSWNAHDLLEKALQKLFVCGTLKYGQPGHSMLTNPGNGYAKYWCRATTTEKMPLVLATRYNIPFLLNKPGVGNYVLGEIYEVDYKMLSSLDNLEDCSDKYIREVRDMNIGVGEGTVPCWVYLLQQYPEHLLTRPTMAKYENSSTHPYVMRQFRTHKHPPQEDLAYSVAQ